ncbi:hypothetical protein CRUP_011780 [Coryphaenoides rupestris]|nr:hypothetical protein CRUP_011780 [Coryphaenoides rupestris]
MSVIRLMLMNLWPLMPMSLKLLYSPGLMYIILPLYWGCSYISQWPSITLQDWQSDMRPDKTNTTINMGKITFYEERNFQGRSYECIADCADHVLLPEQHRGQFRMKIYERENYGGHSMR